MNRFNLLAAAFAAGATTLSAHAVVLDAKFSGTVQTQLNAGFALNAPISGEFFYDTSSASFVAFTVAGRSVAPGFGSTAALTPDLFTALYRAQVSPVPAGGGSNSSFDVDLEALNTPWSAASAAALLTDAVQLAGNLDTVNSSFGFYTANADGTDVRSVSAALTGLQVTTPVPEPASVALMLAGLAAIGVGGRLRAIRTAGN